MTTQRNRLVGLLMLVGLFAAALRLAWISDDAYITLRTVENAVDGRGLVWNAGERVQTYTHPLWMMLLVGARVAIGNHFVATIGLSLLMSILGAALLARLAAGRAPAVLALLLASGAYCDFTSSGLETPLSGLLLVALATVDARTPIGGSRPFAVALCVGLLGMTRLDLLVIAGPTLLAHLRGGWRKAAAGMAPLAAWTAFAVFYYGSPVPITAYAKAIGNGIAAEDLAAQGLVYLGVTWTNDPLTILVIAFGIVIGLAASDLRGRMLALGVLCYLAYVVRIGGDFMAGRFLVPPFVASAGILARALAMSWPANAAASWAMAVVAMLTASLFPPGYLPWSRPADSREFEREVDGVVDERRFYGSVNSLFGAKRDIPVWGRAEQGAAAGGTNRPLVLRCWAAGRVPFEAGVGCHFVDSWILDPLLMRLPAVSLDDWRIGHFARGIPDGYLATLAKGDNRIAHPGLASFYDDLREVIRGPLCSGDRLAAMWRIWSGRHAQAIADFVANDYRSQKPFVIDAQRIAIESLQGIPWMETADPIVVGRGGVLVKMAGPAAGRALKIWATPLLSYRLKFFRGEHELASATVEVPHDAEEATRLGGGRLLADMLVSFRQVEVVVPSDAGAFDAVLITAPQNTFQIAVVGAIELAR